MSAPAASPRSTPAPGHAFPTHLLLKRLSYIMLVRVVLFTLLLGGTVAMHFAWRRPEALGGPYITVLFVFIAVIYVVNILYAVLLRLAFPLPLMASLQIAVDIATSAVLVHFTGSAESAFVLFFLLTPIAAAVTLSRRGTLLTVGASLWVMGATILFGKWRLLPILSGQQLLPWDVPTVEVARSLLLNGGAMAAIAALSTYLADMLRSAASEVQEQKAHLADLEALHDDVVRCLTSGLITLDNDHKIIAANQAAERLLLRGADELIATPLQQISPELAAVLDNPSPRLRQEVEIAGGDAPRFFGVSISPLTDREQRQIGQIINFQDLTQYKALERSAQRAEHLAALGRVAAGVAHEIRNPLASISGSLELLASERALTDEGRQLTSIAQREIERLEGLISELLDYTRAGRRATLKPFDLGAEIHALVASLAGLRQADADAPEVVVHCDDRDCWIDGDRDLLTGMLWNLVRNAAEAGEKNQVQVLVSADETDILLQVRDGGAGIPPEEIDHIFEPFFSTKTKGSGLGLAIVHRSVLDHGARIEVESTPGEGSTFRIRFPRIPAPA